MDIAASRDGTATSQAGTRHGVILMAAAIMPAMAIISLVPVLPLLLREFAAVPGSSVLVPIAMTVPALCVAIFSPAAGWLADRVGRKWLLVTALLLYSVIGVVPFFLHDLHWIVAFRVLLGLTEAAITTVATTLLGDYYTGERRERWIAIQTAVVSFSAIVLIAAGGVLGEIFASRGPFLLYLLALPIAVASAISLFEPALPKSSSDDSAFPFARVMPIVAITLGAALLFYTMLIELGPILETAGTVSPAAIGGAGAAANLGVVVGSLLFRRYASANRMTLLAGGFGLAAIGYLGVSQAAGLWTIASFAVVSCVGGGILLPTLLTWVLQILPPNCRGRGTGLWSGTFFLAQFLAPLIAVALSQATGGLKPALAILGLGAACAVLAAILSRRRSAVTG
ncbi:MFS transporter [Sphingomonas sp. PB4P5]|uniref:MFS transporter n=1 Tax=Parasphingomonas puruogangriensis TaxID=3096155 RepID=UPI002FC829EE